jgi:hypothetical protein
VKAQCASPHDWISQTDAYVDDVERMNARIEMKPLAIFSRLVAMVLLVSAAQTAAADGISAVSTAGSGTLTMCRSWLLFHTCRDYNNVELPSQVAVGDSLPLSFGSNPKDYTFPVARIARDGDGCVLISEATGDPNKANRIEIASCRDVAGSH